MQRKINRYSIINIKTKLRNCTYCELMSHKHNNGLHKIRQLRNNIENRHIGEYARASDARARDSLRISTPRLIARVPCIDRRSLWLHLGVVAMTMSG